MREFVVVYFLHKPTKTIYYLLKDRPSVAKIHNKYLGWGGEVESQDLDLLDTCVREIKEELNLSIGREQFANIGIMTELDVNRVIHFYKVELDEKLPEGHIENEGHVKYMSFNHHKKNPEQFPAGDTILLDTLIQDKPFTRVVVENGIAKIVTNI